MRRPWEPEPSAIYSWCMSLWQRVAARRRRKAHERFLLERARQHELERQDAQQAVRDIATRAAGNQQTGQ
jgi:hypothetical protein